MNNRTAIAVCTLLSSLSGLVGHGVGYHDTRAEAVKALEVSECEDFGRLFPRFRPDDDSPDTPDVAPRHDPDRPRPVLSFFKKVIQGGLQWWCLPGIASTCVFVLCGTGAFMSLVWLVGQFIKVRK